MAVVMIDSIYTSFPQFDIILLIHECRGFDGKAVLRSTVREFLVSEAMHHLGVSTSRALSIISTGQQIRRPWYAAKTNGMMDGSDREYANKNRGGKFSPDTLVREPGAVMCRTAKSFLRFSQLELFAMREEYDELMMLADYVCYREYPHLADIEPAKERYIELFQLSQQIYLRHLSSLYLRR